MDLELDPRHDWLPSSLRNEGVFEIKVHKFLRDNGRWFPAEGRITYDSPDHGQSMDFIVTRCAINRAIPGTRFQLLPAPEGTHIQDFTTQLSRFVGGIAARERLESIAKSNIPATTNRPAVASPEPPGSPWPWILAATSVACAVVATVLVLRRSRNR